MQNSEIQQWGWTRATTQRVAASMAHVCEPPEYSTRDSLVAPYDQAPINGRCILLVQRFDRIEPDDDAGCHVRRLAELQVPLGVVALEDFVIPSLAVLSSEHTELRRIGSRLPMLQSLRILPIGSALGDAIGQALKDLDMAAPYRTQIAEAGQTISSMATDRPD
jgi:hypothetical protein